MLIQNAPFIMFLRKLDGSHGMSLGLQAIRKLLHSDTLCIIVRSLNLFSGYMATQ